MRKAIYLSIIVLAGLLIMQSCKTNEMKYLKEIKVEKLHVKQGNKVYLGVSADEIGEVLYVKNEASYTLAFIELDKNLEIKISQVINNHPSFDEPVIRFIPSKIHSEPYKFVAVIIEK